ncbi:type II secretion system secretin GspD [Uliginosibacterium gangwonense]|uniref:type II secretion system secretin GspD n=1 Tax=Uliginosibacterium gangwonense TaxID=392736 RepID=UPI0012F74057|nr:type II secretion system secretin GspD [Uliginosibacterium gangwonense]
MLITRSSISCLLFMLLSGLCVTGQAQTPPASPPPANQENGNLVSLNFNSVDIDAVVKAIGKISGKNFVVDPRVKGTLNIVTNSPVPRSLTYSILLSALRLQGYAAIEANGIVTILPEADAKMHSVPVGKARTQTTGDKIVTEVFQIRHESASQLLQVIRPLVTPNNTVSVYPGNNSLIITDYAENLGRISKIIESIDVPPSDSLVIPVLHASAVDLAAMLNKLYSETAAGGGTSTEPSMKVSILADARSNSLLVRAENRSRMQAVRSMASQLDQAGATSNIRVIFLKNANAVKVAQTLRAVLSGDSGGNSSSSSSTSLSGNNNSSSSSTSNNSSNSTNTSSSSMSTSGGNFSQSGNNSNVVGSGNIFADVANNALVITGTDAIYNNIRAVIDELDRRQAQVYVEALIAEITSDRAAEYGIQWQSALPTNGSTTVYGGTNFGSASTGNNIIGLASSLATGSGTVAKGMNFIIGSGPVKINGTEIMNLNLLARLLESDANANILSTPSILTVDNEEAKIVVGKNVPFITGSYTTTSTTSSTPFQTYERKDVGLTLKIKPQITEGGSIRMQVYQEVSAVIDSTTTSTSGASTTKRSIESTVVVDNGSIIALGGLMQDSYSGSVEKVPLLGDLPFIGALFRYDTRSRSKTNLMIFLRPRVLRSAEDTAELSRSRYDQIIGVEKNADSPKALMRNEAPLPTLPTPEDQGDTPAATLQ